MHIAGIEISLRAFKRIPNIGEIDSKLVGIDDLIQTNNFTKLSGIMSPLFQAKTCAVQCRCRHPRYIHYIGTVQCSGVKNSQMNSTIPALICNVLFSLKIHFHQYQKKFGLVHIILDQSKKDFSFFFFTQKSKRFWSWTKNFGTIPKQFWT